MEPILRISDLSVSFNGVRAVDNVSFELFKGETLALVGESGSGKSVTSRAIMGLLPDSATVRGRIEYNGEDAFALHSRHLRGKGIAMIFQDPLASLDPLMRVGKQIAHAVRLGDKKLSRRAAKERAIELLGEVGIDLPRQRYGCYPFQLSGGMRQRVMIAVALALEPRVLICDEPTTALDVTVQAQVLDKIQSLKNSRGLSVLFITHDLGVVAKMADRVAVMCKGRVVEQGTDREIFYSPKHPCTRSLLFSRADTDHYKKQKGAREDAFGAAEGFKCEDDAFEGADALWIDGEVTGKNEDS